MSRKQQPAMDPVGGSKSPTAGKRPKDSPEQVATPDDESEPDSATQARETESALDRALGRIPSG